MMNPSNSIKFDAIDKVIEHLRRAVPEAVQRGDWQGALEHTATGIVWRSIRLAARIGAIPADFDPTAPIRAQLDVALHRCELAALAACEQSAPDYRADALAEVLTATREVVRELERGAFRTPDGACRLALVAGNLGRCETMLGFAEEGFWEQVYMWRCQQGGRPPGLNPKGWKVEAVELIKQWLAAEPNLTPKQVEDKLISWLRAANRNIDRESVKSGLRDLRKKKLVQLQCDIDKAG